MSKKQYKTPLPKDRVKRRNEEYDEFKRFLKRQIKKRMLTDIKNFTMSDLKRVYREAYKSNPITDFKKYYNIKTPNKMKLTQKKINNLRTEKGGFNLTTINFLLKTIGQTYRTKKSGWMKTIVTAQPEVKEEDYQAAMESRGVLKADRKLANLQKQMEKKAQKNTRIEKRKKEIEKHKAETLSRYTFSQIVNMRQNEEGIKRLKHLGYTFPELKTL